MPISPALGGLRVMGWRCASSACGGVIIPSVTIRSRTSAWRARARPMFRQGQLAGRLPKVEAGGHLDAVGALPEVDLIEVAFQDLVLGQAALDLQRQRHLREFAAENAFLSEEEGTGQLLGNRTAALDDLPRLQVVPHRPGDADEVHATVLVEAGVFDGQHGLADVPGDLGQGDRDAVLPKEAGDQFAVGRVDAGRLAGRAVDAGDVGQVAPGNGDHDPRADAQGDERREHQTGENGQQGRDAPAPRGTTGRGTAAAMLRLSGRTRGHSVPSLYLKESGRSTTRRSARGPAAVDAVGRAGDRKSTRLNSSHGYI